MNVKRWPEVSLPCLSPGRLPSVPELFIHIFLKISQFNVTQLHIFFICIIKCKQLRLPNWALCQQVTTVQRAFYAVNRLDSISSTPFKQSYGATSNRTFLSKSPVLGWAPSATAWGLRLWRTHQGWAENHCMAFNFQLKRWECIHFRPHARPQSYCQFSVCQLEANKAVSPCNEDNLIKDFQLISIPVMLLQFLSNYSQWHWAEEVLM